MRQSNFTKGEWCFDESGSLKADGETINVIAVIYPSSHSKKREMDSNINLIEASPDMYEFIETYMGGHPEAEQVLAKARGEL